MKNGNKSMTDFLRWNINENILKNFGNKPFQVTIDFHSMDTKK